MISCQTMPPTTTVSTSSPRPLTSPTAIAVRKPSVPAGSAVDRGDVADCYARCSSIAADSAVTQEQSLVNARLQLEQRVASASMTIGDSTVKVLLLRRIGGGSFGDVYLGQTVDGSLVAVKMELSGSPSSARCLLHEGDVYRKLAGCPGIPNVVWYGMHGSEYSALAMDLLGPTLYGVWSRMGQRFTMSTLLAVVDQTLETISAVHRSGIIHRDISPSNFMLGPPSSQRIYLIDFGQAKKMSGHVVPSSRHRFSFTRPIVGTPRFASIFSHAGVEPSYRDDLEALGYMWIYLAKGSLPWQGIRDCSGPEKIGRIGQLKMAISLEDLCSGLPSEFCQYMMYVRRLRPIEFPNHDSIRVMFQSLATRLCLNTGSDHLDWLGFDLREVPSDEAADANAKLDADEAELVDDDRGAEIDQVATPVSK